MRHQYHILGTFNTLFVNFNVANKKRTGFTVVF